MIDAEGGGPGMHRPAVRAAGQVWRADSRACIQPNGGLHVASWNKASVRQRQLSERFVCSAFGRRRD